MNEALSECNAWVTNENGLSGLLESLFHNLSGRGDIWLLNNDLALWQREGIFEELYCKGIFGRYKGIVGSIQIVLTEEVFKEVFPQGGLIGGSSPDGVASAPRWFERCLRAVRRSCGSHARWFLQRLHFANVEDVKTLMGRKQDVIEWIDEAKQTMAFYVLGKSEGFDYKCATARLDSTVAPKHSAIIVRPLRFPFSRNLVETTQHPDAPGNQDFSVAGIYSDSRATHDDFLFQRIQDLRDIFNPRTAVWPRVFGQLCITRGLNDPDNPHVPVRYGLLNPDDVAWATAPPIPTDPKPILTPHDRAEIGVLVANQKEYDGVVDIFRAKRPDADEFDQGRDRHTFFFVPETGNMVLTKCPQGQVSAAVYCADQVRLFRPVIVCVLGSCGGYVAGGLTDIPDLQLGDVVVVTAVLPYDHRKVSSGPGGTRHVKLRGQPDYLWHQDTFFRSKYDARVQLIDQNLLHIHLNDEDVSIIRNTVNVAKDNYGEQVAKLTGMATRLLDTGKPYSRVWLGAVLSGGELVEDEGEKNDLHALYADAQKKYQQLTGPIAAFDMEIHGAVVAARHRHVSSILAMKGIMDDGTGTTRALGTEHREKLKDALQKLATKNSARVLEWLLRGTSDYTGPVCSKTTDRCC